MMIDEEDAPGQNVSHQPSADSSALSFEELDRRIALLASEIDRLKLVKQPENSSVFVADRVFKI